MLTIMPGGRSQQRRACAILQQTANRLLAVERTVVGGVPKAAEEAMENLKLYVVFCAPEG
jgi:hypothetical protein